MCSRAVSRAEFQAPVPVIMATGRNLPKLLQIHLGSEKKPQQQRRSLRVPPVQSILRVVIAIILSHRPPKVDLTTCRDGAATHWRWIHGLRWMVMDLRTRTTIALIVTGLRDHPYTTTALSVESVASSTAQGMSRGGQPNIAAKASQPTSSTQ